MSYATFKIEDVQIDVGHEIVVSGKIRNNSKINAAEVIQVYLYRLNSRVIPRVKELKGFAKVWLAPGEEKTFSIILTEQELEEFVLGIGYELIPGEFDLLVEATDFSKKLKIEVEKL